jgi:hypothetical protein
MWIAPGLERSRTEHPPLSRSESLDSDGAWTAHRLLPSSPVRSSTVLFSGVTHRRVAKVTALSTIAIRYSLYAMAAPIAPTAQMLAAVAVPCTASSLLSFRIAPAPMNPIPVTSPSSTRACALGSGPKRRCPRVRYAALARATSGKVRSPIVRSAASRSYPIGTASR